MLLGCIADDFTGATDLANNLVRAGMRCVLTNGIPKTDSAAGADTDADADKEAGADAVVVALKSRTIPAAEAVDQSLAALAWLKARGARQIYFKVCSTFDSTDKGNIGPVTEALMDALDSDFSIACPAFPENRRTVFKGYLFAGDGLLNESGMQNHPLTPMTDPNLVRVMQRQCRRTVGLIDYSVVGRGTAAIGERIAQLRTQGVGIAIADAIDDRDLMQLGAAVASLPVITAGSGVAIGLPQNFGLGASAQAAQLPDTPGRRAIVSGSCSVATLAQVAAYRDAGRPAYALPFESLAEQQRGALEQRVAGLVAQALQWYRAQSPDEAPLLYSSAPVGQVQALQSRLGVAAAGETIERALSAIAVELVRAGVRNLLVAGGETSGAVVQALAIERLRIGPQIDPGVPWCATRVGASDGQWLRLALKSGNFGATDFFSKAWNVV